MSNTTVILKTGYKFSSSPQSIIFAEREVVSGIELNDGTPLKSKRLMVRLFRDGNVLGEAFVDQIEEIKIG